MHFRYFALIGRQKDDVNFFDHTETPQAIVYSLHAMIKVYVAKNGSYFDIKIDKFPSHRLERNYAPKQPNDSSTGRTLSNKNCHKVTRTAFYYNNNPTELLYMMDIFMRYWLRRLQANEQR